MRCSLGLRQPLRSVDRHAAIDIDHGAGDVGGQVGGQEQIDVGL